MKRNGFSTIIAVIILGSVGLSLVLTLAMLSISSNRIKNTYYYAKKADAVINACVSKGLMDVRKNVNFTGAQVIEVDGESCEYTISFLGESVRRIEATVTVKNNTKKVRAKFLIEKTKMVISDWEEVDNF